MQNGTYHIKHKLLITEYKLVVYNGSFKLLSMDNKFIKTYPSEYSIMQHCTLLSQLPSEPKKYNITWFLNGKPKEVIQMNTFFAIAQAKINALQKQPQYKIGLLRPTVIT